MGRRFAVRSVMCGLLTAGMASIATAQPASGREQPASPTPAVVVARFHAALAAGDSAGASRLLDTAVVVLESGDLETRATYLRDHLPADIRFARSAKSVRQVKGVEEHEGTAWVVSTSRATGKFEGRAVDSDGAELIVLRRVGQDWRIVAIHWSSRKHRR
jgi:hypothetical protein